MLALALSAREVRWRRTVLEVLFLGRDVFRVLVGDWADGDVEDARITLAFVDTVDGVNACVQSDWYRSQRQENVKESGFIRNIPSQCHAT